MADTYAVAETAAVAVTDFLHQTFDYTVAVHNVEADPAYQAHDVDLLWTILNESDQLQIVPVEVKGDRYHRSGNFFFETVSNAARGTPGCFFYTRATWLMYYFVAPGRLYCLPLERVRPWFLQNIDRFVEKRTSTPVGRDSYITIGRLVPIRQLLAEVADVRQYERPSRAGLPWRWRP